MRRGVDCKLGDALARLKKHFQNRARKRRTRATDSGRSSGYAQWLNGVALLPLAY